MCKLNCNLAGVSFGDGVHRVMRVATIEQSVGAHRSS